jgi:hypothetical protein
LGNQQLDYPQARPESFRRGEGGEETKNVMFLELSPFGHYKEINQVHLPNYEKKLVIKAKQSIHAITT